MRIIITELPKINIIAQSIKCEQVCVTMCMHLWHELVLLLCGCVSLDEGVSIYTFACLCVPKAILVLM